MDIIVNFSLFWGEGGAEEVISSSSEKNSRAMVFLSDVVHKTNQGCEKSTALEIADLDLQRTSVPKAP